MREGRKKGKREGGRETAWKEGVTNCRVMYKQKLRCHMRVKLL